MLQHKTKCSQKLSEYLQELARKEDLELLRAPLREFDLFPPDKDATTAIITMEELKKLVRHWKLHETRGFWKMHPTKEDLVSALLEYMDDKEDYSRKPTRPTSSKPSKDAVRARGRRRSHMDLSNFRVSGFKPYSGDLFSQHDHTDGLIYLSRQSIRNSTTSKTQPPQKSSRNRHNAFLSSEFLGVGDSNPGKQQIVTEEQVVIAERQRMQWHAIVIEIFRYSMEAGDELDIINEGALQVIDKINHSDQVTASLANLEMAMYCAATLLNLACSAECRPLLMPPQQMTIAEALNVISTHHSSESIAMLLCVLTLGYLSLSYGGEDALIATCLSTLGSAVAVDSTTCRKAAMATLANLFVASERNQAVEHILPTLKSLTSLNEIDSALLVISTIYNLSFYDMPRITLVEGGTVVFLGALLSTVDIEISPGKPETIAESSAAFGFDGQAALHTLAECVLNLSCTIDARERMIKDGAVTLLVELEQLVVHKSTKEVIGLALANLTVSEVADMLPTVVDNGAIPTLVSLTEAVVAPEACHRLAVAFCNLSSEPANREHMVEQGSHHALVKLSTNAPPTSSCQPLILVAFINMLSLSINQRAVVDAGLLPLLQRLSTEDASDEVKRYCGMALANIADDLSLHTKETHEIVIAMMTKLASSTEIELQRIVASAFAMFAYILTVCEDDDHGDHVDGDNARCGQLTPLTDDVIETILKLCKSTDTTVLKFAGITLNNLSQEVGYHEGLFRNNVSSALLQLAESRDDEVRRMCACTLHSLTSSGKLGDVKTNVVKGFIKVLGALENSRSADVINFCAAGIFSISCMRVHCAILTTESSILRRLFGMMRGGQESTQLYAARALCNLTCEESCVRTLLREQAIADFIAIAILRTNNEEVKGVCAECLFNLIRYDETRPQLLREPNNVLWAISRLFRYCVESERTQRIGALVVYNLSCDQQTAKTLMKTINAAETLTAVAMHVETEPKEWAAAALCNLSWTSEFAAQLVIDAGASRPHAENGVSGAVRLMRMLLDADFPDKSVADTVNMQCATTLYNMSQCSEEVRERLIDDGVTVFIEKLLEMGDNHIIEMACIVCYNISLAPGCEVALVDYQVAGSLMKLLRLLVPPPDESMTHPAFPSDHASTFLLILGTLYNLTIKLECRSSLETAGVSDACIAVGRLRGVPQEQLELITAMLQNLSWESENHRPLVAKGCALMEMLNLLVSSPGVTCAQLLDVANILCNLSCSTALGEQVTDMGMVDLLAQVTLKAGGSEAMLNLCATAARNLSNINGGKYNNTVHPSWLRPEIEMMMRALATLGRSGGSEAITEDQHARLDDVAACLYNVLIIGGPQLRTADSLSSILTALFKLCERPETRSLCASALIARQGDKDSAHYSDGSVSALHSAMHAEIAAYDAETVATPKSLRQDRRSQHPGISADKLGSRFALLQPDRSTIASKHVERCATSSIWKSFAQDANVITQGLEVPATQSMKLPKQPAYPPRSTYTKTSGQFRKILFLPSKVRSTISSSNEHAQEIGGERSESTSGESMHVPLRFDFARMFNPLS
ncbi:hypothetical protein CTAYLR_001828 [Chrysophaeum taylorii]|uniref:Vacuolar protein 8 n=1 Tax=Chrysophaeum taylorii TaxID=2483200 RepID=A0AAD7U8A7_9STRA|nr:hypothetical protein CTAYLR_001828 [Chrysophaeum taylorii]